jgi:hypothetical protein
LLVRQLLTGLRLRESLILILLLRLLLMLLRLSELLRTHIAAHCASAMLVELALDWWGQFRNKLRVVLWIRRCP